MSQICLRERSIYAELLSACQMVDGGRHFSYVVVFSTVPSTIGQIATAWERFPGGSMCSSIYAPVIEWWWKGRMSAALRLGMMPLYDFGADFGACDLTSILHLYH